MALGAEEWEKAKSLFVAALERPPEERRQFVEQSCPDEWIRTEVLSLLRNSDSAGSFLITSEDQAVSQAGMQVRSAQTLDLNTQLGPYKITAFIGAGGMGEVYRARDTRLDREVAIKVLPSRLSQNGDLRLRFEREAKAISGLQNPNICVLYDIGRQDGVDFLVMEYLHGETLSARLDRGPVPCDEAVRIAMAVAGALDAAHRKGIIHRDLKPGNIMLSRGTAQLLDFGIAKYEQFTTPEDSTLTEIPTEETQVIGTLPYMSPEQLEGKRVDARADVFAFGAVLYEMLTGRKAFQRSEMKLFNHDAPRPVREFVKGVPAELERIIQRCLRQLPEERYASMSQVLNELESCHALISSRNVGMNLRAILRLSRRPKVAISLLIATLVLASLIAWRIRQDSRENWARNVAVPQIARLIDDQKLTEAYDLAVQAERYIPHDPLLVKFWPKISWSALIITSPPGASVYRRDYKGEDTDWEFVGRTPIDKQRFPQTDSRWKFELKGYETAERATFSDAGAMTVTLDEQGKSPPGMVHVELAGSESETAPVPLSGLAGYESVPAVPLKNYWIDKFEVTNVEYKKFVDQGGYQNQKYWKQEFRKAGKVLQWAEAMKLFQDSTGRPGPATWVQGEYPTGQDDYPVIGVSWFEAAAYAEFAGKSLPTIYHWMAAASPQDAGTLIPASNSGGTALAPVGKYADMSRSGAFDMAGNVKEWILNEADSGKRYILGGAWNEPAYTFNDPDARSPFDRAANFGFRCAKYVLTGESARAADPLKYLARDYSSERPVSDQVFQIYKGLYSYDKTPLHAMTEPFAQTEDWKEEKLTFDAAYPNERITAYLFLPKKASPPFETIVFFPGANAFRTRSSDNSRYLTYFDFVVKSGRAVMFPVYKGSFERWDDVIWQPKISSSYRDHVIAWSKDLSRSIDYLETRPDIDRNKLGYEGYSMGAALGALFPAVEDRFKVVVLVSPGFWMNKRLSEVDTLNFAPRVKAPTLMLNGRFDFVFPAGSSQEPMFRLLGTPKERKRRMVYDTGHDIPRTEIIKETLKWLDQYLGPVK